MRRTLLILVCILPYLLHAQPRIKNKKYQGLLWEISGKGMKKPSYLFGTMHVSSKLAFHLADSFYLGIRNADVVALETNPESWQEDMSKYQTENNDYNSPFRMGSYSEEPNDFLDINTLKFYKYEKKIERALYSNPSMINNLLYRSYGNESSDFEEDTYLDMYIYQCGKKWGKKVAGVEKYGESMKLMAEAYRDAAKDKNKKDRSYNSEGGYSYNKLQEAYRSGNLDWLDSINKYNSISAAFDEKFLYKRNEIQAQSIDSILRSGHSLFVGVGAAHLPGNRGVIEMLRAMGYQLRPVKMGARDSQHKLQVEKLRVPITFTTQTATDGVYKVDIPGKFYKFGDDFRTDQEQYADMANGSYYMVTRIMTNAWMWGHSSAKIQKIVDSLLYENVPGKILNKTNITRNGYPGFDITNKTRRGDIQRYSIFVTPFEIIVFKMSGNADYVINGDEAKRFFGSIQLKEFKPSAENVANWKKYSPSYGGFSIDMPHEPFVGNDGSWIYDAEDKSTNTQYRVIRTDIHNYHFVEEDSFDLSLLEESFAASDFIDKKLDRKLTNYKGYPALDCKFSDKNGGVYLTRFIIQGAHYYSLISHGKNENAAMKNFLNSFELKPFNYPATRERKDTSMFFTVNTPVYPDADKQKLEIPGNNYLRNSDSDDDDENDYMVGGTFRSRTIVNDTTGEKVHVEFFKSPRYFYMKDSTIIEKEYRQIGGDSSWIFRVNKKYETPDKFKVWESVVSDTGSSRILWSKIYYRNGLGFSLLTQLDTLTPPSSFVKSFYETFKPADTLTGVDLFVKKNKLFFQDFNSKDSATRRKAIKGISMVELDSTDLPALKQAIGSLNWKEKKYLDLKKLLIGKLDDIKTRQSAEYAKDIYYAAGDTLELQYAALEVLLKHKNQYAYKVFRDIMVAEPPVLDNNQSYDYNSNNIYAYTDYSRRGRSGGNFMNELSDTLPLTRTILPDILPLINLEDYKSSIMGLLVEMVDSNLVKPADYQIYFTKFLIEAKQEYKKQAIAEKQDAIEKAEQIKADGDDKDDKNNDWDESEGNDDLQAYATLLLPSWDANPQVKTFINQLLSSNDVRLKYNVMMLLLRNNKPCPDSLVKYFAKSDQYRYEFYKDLKAAGLSSKFPSSYSSHLDLAKSKLLNYRRYSDYGNPDSLVYIDRLPLETKGKKGYVYFFKYKFKKDDPSWRLASVGLVPEDANKFEFETGKSKMVSWGYDYEYDENLYQYEYTGYYSTKVKEDQPIKAQLTKQLRMVNYSKRKSARNFYNDNEDSEEDTDQDQVVISHDE